MTETLSGVHCTRAMRSSARLAKAKQNWAHDWAKMQPKTGQVAELLPSLKGVAGEAWSLGKIFEEVANAHNRFSTSVLEANGH